MEKEYFDGIPESGIEWNGTHDLAVNYLNKMGFDVIEKEDDKYFKSHEYIEFLTMEAYYFGCKFGQEGE
jgi:hypothetical protein